VHYIAANNDFPPPDENVAATKAVSVILGVDVDAAQLLVR